MHLINATSFLCGMHAHEFEPVEIPPLAYTAPQGDELQERIYDVPHSYSSEHFVIHWGDDEPVFPGFEVLMAADLEASWEHQVEVRGWERPLGTDTFKMDVYIGNTDENVPSIDFTGGYVTLTLDEGVPYAVISASSTLGYERYPEGAAQLISHEFNHTLQLGEGLYAGPRGRFWFEATANWAAADTTGQDDEIQSWGPYLLHPEFALYSFQSIYDNTETARTQRQYAAAMFVRFLSDRHGPDLIRQSWDETDTSAQPINWLDGQLEAGIRQEYADFAVSHAVGDHPYATLYSEGVRRAAQYYGQTSVTAYIEADGSFDIEPDTWPEAFGWNHLAYTALEAGTMDLQFSPGTASENSVPDFLNTAVVERQGTFSYHPFDEALSLELEAGDFVHIVLTSVPQSHRDREIFPYDLDIEITPLEEKKACGCQGAPTSAWGLLLLPFLARRRGEA